jgi:hypothetical protein
MVSQEGEDTQAFQILPDELVKMDERKAVAFLMDMVTQLGAENKSGS